MLRDLLAGKVVLLDVSGLGSTEEVLVASYLTCRVLEAWQSAYLDRPEVHERMPVVAVVLEEANGCYRRARAASRTCFLESPAKDRNILRASAKQDISAIGKEIQTLMPGECLIAGMAAPFAMPAKVDLYNDLLRATPPAPAPRPAAAANICALVGFIPGTCPGELLTHRPHAPFPAPGGGLDMGAPG